MKNFLFTVLDWIVGFILFGIVGPTLRLIDPKGTRLIKRLQRYQDDERKAPQLTPSQRDRLRAKVREHFRKDNHT